MEIKWRVTDRVGRKSNTLKRCVGHNAGFVQRANVPNVPQVILSYLKRWANDKFSVGQLLKEVGTRSFELNGILWNSSARFVESFGHSRNRISLFRILWSRMESYFE